MNQKSHPVATFKARCSSCGSVCVHPSLGDFAYGEFIFSGERGTVYAVLSTFENPVWDFLQSLPDLQNESSATRGDRLRTACAILADPVKDQRLKPTLVCPDCAANTWEWDLSDRRGTIDIPSVTFARFMGEARDRRQNLGIAALKQNI